VDPERTRRFRRGGLDGEGALKIPGLDSEGWQRKATRAFYLRPFFIWDTILFTLQNPYFMRHLINLGVELLPMYKLARFWPKRSKTAALDRENALAKCPSLPTADYKPVQPPSVLDNVILERSARARPGVPVERPVSVERVH
jgi:hypothetical protein